PPYDDELDTVIAAAGHHLAPGGVSVLEHARRRATAERAGALQRTRELISGDSALTFYVMTP
ncbi:MAG: 16S rRNA (guanine(966)-N(2))-methyltransferase RsmD, partial [Acidobacteria bacterium]|nr:16S rRNA (guanine(966)-N(2))-methyltransferase RsmD [Acidobacteriota bacterium]